MDEAAKTNKIRTEEFKRTYFSGRVIDIGCGPDLVVPHAVPFDLEHGDAQRVLDYFPAETFDCVHSSHCLEHMRDVRAALGQWWALVKPGGHLVIVVPHEELYEQGAWPSLFNSDHKATFNLGTRNPALAVSYDIAALVRELPAARIIDATVQDDGLDYRLLRRATGLRRTFFLVASRRRRLFRALMRRGLPFYRADLILEGFERRLGKPFDQTLGDALAQIQVVASKTCADSNPAA
jgi:SAM-dependent methyltransferase